MLELTTDAMTETVEATAGAVQSGLRLAPSLLRIFMGLLMLALGAILWLVTTLLDEYERPRSHPRQRAHA